MVSLVFHVQFHAQVPILKTNQVHKMFAHQIRYPIIVRTAMI